MRRKTRRKATHRHPAGSCCPGCGILFTDDEIQLIYEYRRRQIGGRIGGAVRKFEFPEGWIGLVEASAMMGINLATLRYRAEHGSPLVYRKFGGHWAVLKELAR